jgi:hypothetical protein
MWPPAAPGRGCGQFEDESSSQLWAPLAGPLHCSGRPSNLLQALRSRALSPSPRPNRRGRASELRPAVAPCSPGADCPEQRDSRGPRSGTQEAMQARGPAHQGWCCQQWGLHPPGPGPGCEGLRMKPRHIWREGAPVQAQRARTPVQSRPGKRSRAPLYLGTWSGCNTQRQLAARLTCPRCRCRPRCRYRPRAAAASLTRRPGLAPPAATAADARPAPAGRL